MEPCEVKYRSIFGTDGYGNLLNFSDFKLRSKDGCCFDVHKVTLARSGSFFRDLLCGPRDAAKEITIPGISGEILAEILLYVYDNQVNATVENSVELLLAADYLMLQSLIDAIQAKLRRLLTVGNSLQVLYAAERMNNAIIAAEAFRFVVMHFTEVLSYPSTSLADMSLDVVRQFLSCKNLNVVDEREVWSLIVDWVDAGKRGRVAHVPLLLQHLARKEVGEELATDIIHHDLVAANPHCKGFNDYRKRHANDIAVVLFSENHLGHRVDRIDYRAPDRLHVVARLCHSDRDRPGDSDRTSEIFITYDESLDYWYRMQELYFVPNDWPMACLGGCVYFYDDEDDSFVVLDLLSNTLIPVRCRVENLYHYVAVDGLLFVVYGNCLFGTFSPEAGLWSDVSADFSLLDLQVVATGGKAYVVGYERGVDVMGVRKYDPRSTTWSTLPPPTMFRSHFLLTAFKEKLFINGYGHRGESPQNVEIFDTQNNSNVWRVVESGTSIFFTEVFNDSLLGFAKTREVKTCFRWSESKERWCEYEGRFHKAFWSKRLAFCPVDDAGAVRDLTKAHRRECWKFEKSPFD